MTLAFNATLDEAELREAIADITQTLILADGQEVDASVTTGPEIDGLEIGGVTDKTRMSAVLVAEDCNAEPVANDVVTFSGRRYRVEGVTLSDDGLSLAITAVGEFE